MNLFSRLLNVGITDQLIPYERRRAKVFNTCNLTGMLIALLRLAYLFFNSTNHYTDVVILVNALPLLICGVMFICMVGKHYQMAIGISFLFFPLGLVIMAGMTGDRDLEVYLFLYVLFVFFFLHHPWQIIMTFCWVTACIIVVHFSLPLVPAKSSYRPDRMLAIIDYSFGLVFIFLALYFIKFEVWKFEKSINRKKDELKKLNAIKDKVFSVISHDLRSPIGAIIMLLREINEASMTVEEFNEYLPDLLANMEQTGDLLDNLLAWARSQIKESALNVNEISLNRLTAQTLKFLGRTAASKNIRLVNDVPVDCSAFADESSIRIVLRNLIANAIKFTGSGGIVKVKCNADGSFVKIMVEDNGIGIPVNKQQFLFGDEYYTSLGTNKETGSGLGLLICKDLIQKNGGSLQFTSEPGNGTTFSFSLPSQN
jgi:two-component system, sensor histidine kinase and response regulator